MRQPAGALVELGEGNRPFAIDEGDCDAAARRGVDRSAMRR
jgi:hypothetical protein